MMRRIKLHELHAKMSAEKKRRDALRVRRFSRACSASVGRRRGREAWVATGRREEAVPASSV